MDHLRVLHEANLISVEREGRTRWNRLNPVPLREMYARWMQPIAEAPADELLGLKATAEARRDTSDVRDRSAPTRKRPTKQRSA